MKTQRKMTVEMVSAEKQFVEAYNEFLLKMDVESGTALSEARDAMYQAYEDRKSKQEL